MRPGYSDELLSCLKEISGKLDTIIDAQKGQSYHSSNGTDKRGCIPLEIMKQSVQQAIRGTHEEGTETQL